MQESATRFRAPRAITQAFFADRCPHLAAMLAYYALLSLFPILVLATALAVSLGRIDESERIFRELSRILPHAQPSDFTAIAKAVRRNSTGLGLLGLASLLWSSLGFLSALESALNIVYELPNRSFLRQKFVVSLIVSGALVVTVIGLALATLVARNLPTVPFLSAGLTLVISTVVTFVALIVCFRALPNTDLSLRELVPGTVVSTALIQASFQLLPQYVASVTAVPALKVLGAFAVLLVWLYLLANMLLVGAEVNWWFTTGRHRSAHANAQPIGATPTAPTERDDIAPATSDPHAKT